MLDKLEYNGHVNEQGKLHINNRKDFIEEVGKVFCGKDVEIIVRKKRRVRSEQQNKYWWVCMGLLGKEIGYTKQEIHEIAKFKFLKREKVIEKTGEVVEYLASTTQLTKSEFAEVTDHLIRWAAEMGIVLPAPNQQIEITQIENK